MADAPHPLAPRKLTHEQARAEQRLYWTQRTPAERLAAMRALTIRMYKMRGIEVNDRITDLTPHRIPRRPR